MPHTRALSLDLDAVLARHSQYETERQARNINAATAPAPVTMVRHGDGLAAYDNDAAWAHFTVQPDGTWDATGHLGTYPGPDTDGISGSAVLPVFGPQKLTGPDALYAWLADAAPEPETPLTSDQLAAEAAFNTVTALHKYLRDLNLQVTLLPLTDRVPGLVVHNAGGLAPFQAEGTLHGMPFYFRDRHGQATLKLWSSPEDEEASYFAPLYLSSIDHSDQHEFIDLSEFITLMLDLIPALTRAPRLWRFEGTRTVEQPAYDTEPVLSTTGEIVFASRHVPAVPVGTPTDYECWGDTPEDAWTRLHANDSNYVTDDQWAAHIEGLGLDPQTVTVDDRCWPDPEPNFVVLPAPSDVTELAAG